MTRRKTFDSREEEVADALDFLLRELARRGESAALAAEVAASVEEAAALRGKAAAYAECRTAIQKSVEGARIRRRWQRVHEAHV